MNFEKIINYFRRLGKVFREKFAGLNFKKRDKSLKVRKAGKLRLDLSGIVSKRRSRLKTE